MRLSFHSFHKNRTTPRLDLGLIGALLLSCLVSQGAIAKPSRPELIQYKETVNAKGDAVYLRLHVFKPKDWKAEDQRPVIVFFFGGGWMGGSPAQFYHHSRALADHGMVAISAEYRVENKHGTSPQACVIDGKSAVRYIREHADKLGIDPQKIAAGGGSAGGHVAAATALIPGIDEPNPKELISCVPSLLILFNPVIETVKPDGYGWERLGKDAAAMSPTRGIHAGQPPIMIMHGTADTTVPIKTVRRFKALSKKVGAECIVHEYEGRGHGFFNPKNGRNLKDEKNMNYHDTIDKMTDFLSKHGFLKRGE